LIRHLVRRATLGDTTAMERPSAAEIVAAGARLAGHVVATPVVGGVLWPGRSLPPGLRVKAEVLQPSGSIHFRGAMHWLLRRLGAAKGLVAHGAPRTVLAAALAAHEHRMPITAFTHGPCDPDVEALLGELRCAVRPCATAAAAERAARAESRASGNPVLPGEADPDYAAGLATAGLELATTLPADAELVVVSPAVLARPLALGLAAGGATARVEGVDADPARVPALAREVRAALRLDVGLASCAALWHILERGAQHACAVLTE
jgi:threonine dehydratase